MKIVVWKNGTYKFVNGPTWEYEEDKDWLVTIPLFSEEWKKEFIEKTALTLCYVIPEYKDQYKQGEYFAKLILESIVNPQPK